MCSQYKHKKQIQQSFANKNSNPSADMALASPVLIATSGSSENIIPSDRLSKSVIRHIRCRQTACSQTSDTGVRISAGDRVRRPHNPEANSSPVRNVKYAFCPSTDKITVNNIIAYIIAKDVYLSRRLDIRPTQTCCASASSRRHSAYDITKTQSNMKKLERMSYESPVMQIISVAVEQGIAISSPDNVQGSHEDVNIGTEY